jgi:hypothetical protein
MLFANMVPSFVSLAVVALFALTSIVLAIPTNQPPAARYGGNPHLNNSRAWRSILPSQKWQPCTKEKMQVRQDFDKMGPYDRKAYTDAVSNHRSSIQPYTPAPSTDFSIIQLFTSTAPGLSTSTDSS